MSFFQKIDTIYLFFVRKEWTNLVEHMKAGTSWWIEGKINADHIKNINLVRFYDTCTSAEQKRDFVATSGRRETQLGPSHHQKRQIERESSIARLV